MTGTSVKCSYKGQYVSPALLLMLALVVVSVRDDYLYSSTIMYCSIISKLLKKEKSFLPLYS